jgi:predicted transcriptional regulator
MLSTADVLSSIEENHKASVKRLAKKLEIPVETLKAILADLAEHQLVDYNEKTGRIRLPNWLSKIDQEIEEQKPATGDIILPKYKEIKIQDITIGNFTKNDLELKLRIKAKQKEITICDVS